MNMFEYLFKSAIVDERSDAIASDHDDNTINELKTLAGIRKPNNSDGANMSITANEKARIQREKNIRPGTPEWFQLWFSLPYMTGEKPYDK